jgi:hypothetical protein
VADLHLGVVGRGSAGKFVGRSIDQRYLRVGLPGGAYLQPAGGLGQVALGGSTYFAGLGGGSGGRVRVHKQRGESGEGVYDRQGSALTLSYQIGPAADPHFCKNAKPVSGTGSEFFDFENQISGTGSRVFDFEKGISGTGNRVFSFEKGISGTGSKVFDFEKGISGTGSGFCVFEKMQVCLGWGCARHFGYPKGWGCKRRWARRFFSAYVQQELEKLALFR